MTLSIDQRRLVEDYHTALRFVEYEVYDSKQHDYGLLQFYLGILENNYSSYISLILRDSTIEMLMKLADTITTLRECGHRILYEENKAESAPSKS